MALQQEIYKTYVNHIRNHPEENRRGALAVKEALIHSPLYWNGSVDKTVHIPKVYDRAAIEEFRNIASVAHRIFEKVIREYLEHEDYRKLFPFSKELEELILLPAPYEGLLPIARFDLFYHEDTGKFHFCEINTDGTAAMLRDLEMRKALINNPAHQAVIRKYDLKPFELFDSWVRTFLKLYDRYEKKKNRPNIAIIDILENATLRDFEEFARRFQEAGFPCEICDVRSLVYEDGVLRSPAGNRIDAIYRRAVTADLMEHYEEIRPFLQAVKDDAVFLAGSFATQIIHTKWLFYVLHLDRTKAFLTGEERVFVEDHIPLTVEFTPEYISLEDVQRRKDEYILKPMDAYASKGIYAAGHEYSVHDWNKLTAGLYGEKGMICQQYCPQYLTDNIDFAWGDGLWHPYINMPGLYVYDGEFTGFLMRMACGENIIVAHENERTVPVFMVDSD
ncbi:MAG: glutathionylspermidine synthase family protein [Eubacterium sp.]|nr:glutathionylspermidine synthase family protein [Eubacterium sp.]